MNLAYEFFIWAKRAEVENKLINHTKLILYISPILDFSRTVRSHFSRTTTLGRMFRL